MDQFDVTFGLELIMADLTLEESLPRWNTALRMLRDLTRMTLSQMGGFLDCFGGIGVIGLQSLEKWAEGNPARRECLLEYLAAAGKKSRRRR
jgi:hypothetical protein